MELVSTEINEQKRKRKNKNSIHAQTTNKDANFIARVVNLLTE